MNQSSDFEALASRAISARNSALGVLALFSLTLLGEIGELSGFINLEQIELGPVEWAYLIVLLAGTGAFILSVIAICMWIYRAHANLREAGRDVEYSPGWAVGWYFIPIVNWFKPFGAMRELWNESHLDSDSYGSEAPSNLAVWWGTWVIGNILGNISFRMSMNESLDLNEMGVIFAAASSVFTIVAAWYIYHIIGAITQAQLSHLRVAAVFE
ncbi:MAG: DUF4328 domain-containing protein [Pseudomonadota bacterium]